MDCRRPGSSVHGIFQAWIWEWVAISFSRGSSRPRDRTQVSCIVSRHFTVWATREACSCLVGFSIVQQDLIISKGWYLLKFRISPFLWVGVLLTLFWPSHHCISGILDTSNLSLMLHKSWLPVHWCWIRIWRQRLQEIEKSSFSPCQAKGKCSMLAPQPNTRWIIKKTTEFQKNIYFCFIDYAKAFDVWITINCGKFRKRWEYQTTWPTSWETCMQVRKQQLEMDMEQQTGSQ